jgi:hypothetical protein
MIVVVHALEAAEAIHDAAALWTKQIPVHREHAKRGRVQKQVDDFDLGDIRSFAKVNGLMRYSARSSAVRMWLSSFEISRGLQVRAFSRSARRSSSTCSLTVVAMLPPPSGVTASTIVTNPSAAVDSKRSAERSTGPFDLGAQDVSNFKECLHRDPSHLADS